MSFRIKELEDNKAVLVSQVDELQREVALFITERDRFREDTKDILQVKQNLYIEKLHLSISMKSM